MCKTGHSFILIDLIVNFRIQLSVKAFDVQFVFKFLTITHDLLNQHRFTSLIILHHVKFCGIFVVVCLVYRRVCCTKLCCLAAT